MDQTIHVWPLAPVAGHATTTFAARIERPGVEPRRLEYAIDNAFAAGVADVGDSLAAAMLFSAMKARLPLHVHGRVSPTLLRNLTEFQAAWAHLRPDLYAEIELRADTEAEPPAPDRPTFAAAFSGGVDASFSLWRHTQGLCGRLARPIGAAVMVHGFDISIDRPDTFAKARARASKITQSIGVPLVAVATNWRQVVADHDWEHMHGSALAAVLLLFQRTHAGALIASGVPYRSFQHDWGSTPLMDGRFSTGVFNIEHDAAAFERWQKVEAIAQWPAARRHVRICYEGDDLSVNCGRCYKCLRSVLLFRAVGAGLPECFSQDADDAFIRDWPNRFLTPSADAAIREILDAAKAKGTGGSWTVALEAALRTHLRRKNRPKWLRRLKGAVALRTRLRRLAGAIRSRRDGSKESLILSDAG